MTGWWSNAARSAGSVLLSYAVFVAISTSVDWDHFTWWSLATTGVWGFLNGFFPIAGAAYFFVFAGIQVAVAGGVVIMGLMDCSTFSEAHETHGAAGYILGNYAMHYLPLTASVLLVDKAALLQVPFRLVLIDAALGVGVFYAWSFFQEPLETYGCPHLIEASSIPLITSLLVGASAMTYIFFIPT